MRVTVSGVIDGREQVILDGAPGVDTNEEYDAPISGRHLTYLTLSFS